MSRLVGMATRMASQLLVVTPMGRTVEPGNKEQNLKVVLSAPLTPEETKSICVRNKAP